MNEVRSDEDIDRIAEVLPSEFELTSESNNTQVVINSLGEINLLGKRKLKKIFLFPFLFPEEKYEFCQYTSFPTPEDSTKDINFMLELKEFWPKHKMETRNKSSDILYYIDRHIVMPYL